MNPYFIQPKADSDLDEIAYYYSIKASADVGHRFLAAIHYTFALLAQHPNMGWQSKFKGSNLNDLRVFKVRRFTKILVLYLPLNEGVRILRVVHGSHNLHLLLRREGVE